MYTLENLVPSQLIEELIEVARERRRR